MMASELRRLLGLNCRSSSLLSSSPPSSTSRTSECRAEKGNDPASCVYILSEMLDEVPGLRQRMAGALQHDSAQEEEEGSTVAESASLDSRLHAFMDCCHSVEFDPAEVRELANAMLVSVCPPP